MDISNYEIRKFRPSDRDMVNAFFDQMGGETRAMFDRNSGNRKDAMKYFDGMDKNTIRWMAVDEGRMVGYVFLWDLDKSIPWLGIAVADDLKGKHFGRQLMQHAYYYSIENDKGGILLTTHVANVRGQGLYAHMGYEKLGMHSNGEILYLKRF